MAWENSQNGTMWITNSNKIFKIGKNCMKDWCHWKNIKSGMMRERELMWTNIINRNLL
jgi:hypothetical protein